MVLPPKRKQGPEPLPLGTGAGCHWGSHRYCVSPLAYNKWSPEG